MNTEVWKDIEGYDGLYQVSTLGNVKSLNYRRTGKPQLLRQVINYDGYRQVPLRKNGKMKLCSVHRIVAKAFIANEFNKPEVNHLDCNKANNRVENLEWCTYKENSDYRDIFISRNWIDNHKLSRDEVKDIRQKKKLGNNYKNVWMEYSDKISLSGFEKIWYEVTWKGE